MTNYTTGKILTDFIVVQGYGALQVQIHLLEYKYGDLDVNWETWFKEEYREDVFTLLHQKARERVEKFKHQRHFLKRNKETSSTENFTRPDVVSGKKVRLAYSFKRSNGSKCIITTSTGNKTKVLRGYQGYNLFPEKLIAYAYPLDGYLKMKQQKDQIVPDDRKKAKTSTRNQATETTSSHYFTEENSDLDYKYKTLCKMMKHGKSKTRKKHSKNSALDVVNINSKLESESYVSKEEAYKTTDVETKKDLTSRDMETNDDLEARDMETNDDLKSRDMETDDDLKSRDVETDDALKSSLMLAYTQAVLTDIATATSEQCHKPLKSSKQGPSRTGLEQSEGPAHVLQQKTSCTSEIPCKQSDTEEFETKQCTVEKTLQHDVVLEDVGITINNCENETKCKALGCSASQQSSTVGTVVSKCRKRGKEGGRAKRNSQSSKVAKMEDSQSEPKVEKSDRLKADKTSDIARQPKQRKTVRNRVSQKTTQQLPPVCDSVEAKTKEMPSACAQNVSDPGKTVSRKKTSSKLARLKHCAGTTQEISKSQQRSRNLMLLADEFELEENIVTSESLSPNIREPQDQPNVSVPDSNMSPPPNRRESMLPMADFVSQTKRKKKAYPTLKTKARASKKGSPKSSTVLTVAEQLPNNGTTGELGLDSGNLNPSLDFVRSPTPPPRPEKTLEGDGSTMLDKPGGSSEDGSKRQVKLSSLFGTDSDSADDNRDPFKPMAGVSKPKTRKAKNNVKNTGKSSSLDKVKTIPSCAKQSGKKQAATNRKKLENIPISTENDPGNMSESECVSVVSVTKLKFKKSDKTPSKRKSLDMRTLMEKYRYWPDNQPSKSVDFRELTKSQEQSSDTTTNVEDIFEDCIIQEDMATSTQPEVESDIGKELERQLKCVSDVKDINEEQMQYFVQKNEAYLRNIFVGKTSSRRHADYKEGGLKRVNLSWQIPLALFEEEQTDHIMDALRNLFCKHHNKYLDYLMRVLLPEILIKLVMEVYRKSYQETEKLLEDI